MPHNGVVRLALLVAAAVCVLIGLHFVPAFTPASELAREPALVVNDTNAPVTVLRCTPSCTNSGGGAIVAPGATLRLGGAGEWVISSAAGERLGCIDSAIGGGKFPAARWGPCRD